MTRESIAGVILILLLAASLLNIWYLDDKIDTLSGQVAMAESFDQKGQTEAAIDMMEQSLDLWLSMDSYIHCVLRHDEIDPITDDYHEILDNLNDDDATDSKFRRLRLRLKEIVEMERIKFSSVF